MADTKRRVIDLLPVVNQTETLTKFFAATLDNLMQPESVEFITAYIGNKPSWYNPSTDFYVNEPTTDRATYQLPVSAVSVNTLSGMVNNIMFYDDILNQLSFQGANTNNHSRLFDQEYYSWAPPIDIDKLINYTKYIWLPDGPDTITLLNPTDYSNEIYNNTQYTYTGAFRYDSTGLIVNGSLTFTNGLAIILSDDAISSNNNTKWYIEGVGTGISFVLDRTLSNPGWDVYTWNTANWDGDDTANDKIYCTIARNSIDKNQWSLANRWFHQDILSISNTVITDQSTLRANRPIIEFSKDIMLYDYGWYGRSSVYMVIDNISDVFGTIVGQSSFTYDGIKLVDGMRILVLNDTTNTPVNNRVYTVDGLTQYGSIQLVLAKDGQNADGSPAVGDRLTVQYGKYEGKNLWFNNLKVWRSTGQQYQSPFVPLFDAYDVNGNSFSNPVVYPNSNFSGNAVFGYTNDVNNSPYDSVLDLNPQRDSFGSFVFTNYLATASITYIVNNKTIDYNGYVFYNIKNSFDSSNWIYGNSWHKAKAPSRQYIINDFLNIVVPSSTTPMVFNIDQLPAEYETGTLPTIHVYLTRNQTESELINSVDYFTSVNQLTGQPQVTIAAGTLITGDRITIRTWNSTTPSNITGYYELPLNLTANPNNKEIETISQSQLLPHFLQLMSNQYGFAGNTISTNNYRDTAQDLSLGETILQHRAPLLKTMLLNSGNVATGPLSTVSNTDPMMAMQYAQREYTRFYSKFIRALLNLNKNGYTLGNSTSDWINKVLSQINVGKTQSNPWANSGYDTVQASYTFQQAINPTYIPPTATRLGMAPAFQPGVYLSGENIVIETHDGSRIIMEDDQGNPLGTISSGYSYTDEPNLLTNPVARVWLQFELNLFNDMPDRYQNAEATLAFDVRTITPGKWRTGDYTQSEYISILQPMFDKWVINNQVDFTANTTFDLNDQFSWNYSKQYDKQGLPVPGNWRGIYNWFYDTDRPHTHPWEMLGFSQKPSWWDTQYGLAPYTSGNTAMWSDLRDGIIRQGPRAGTYSEWARPGLLSCIPVDSQGNLLAPLYSGTVSSLPSVIQARAEWVFGDGSPIESVWRHSQDFNFVIAEMSYLMKPARFIEYNWDTLRTQEIFTGTAETQWIYLDTNSRRSSNQFYVQRENPSTIGQGINIPNETTLTYYQSGGLQHWISEFLISNSVNVTSYFGNIIRGGQPRLSHKVGAFINSNTDLRVTSDSFGTIGYKSSLIPSENINVYLYRSASIGSNFYGGVIVKQVSGGWQVFGYDGISQKFTVIPSNLTGAKSTLTLGNVVVTQYKIGQIQNGVPVINTIPYGTTFTSLQQVYDFLISYGRYQTSQGWIFDNFNNANNTMTDWTQSASDFVYWSQTNWADGNFIALSPLADQAEFTQEFGNIEFINGIVGGTYPVVDRAGNPIDSNNLEILRYDSDIVVRSLNEQSIYGLRLFSTTLEHVMIFDNQTSFGDTIYDDLYNIAQQRLKLYAYKTNDWTGRLDAPGYFLYQNPVDNTWSMISNFEKTANDFRKYFNIDQPKNADSIDVISGNVTTVTSQNSVIDRSDIADLAKHMFGYQQRTYLEDLIFEDSTEFQFYQGFIKQKGTTSALTAITRNINIIPIEESFEYYEEFALRLGRYGSFALNTNIDFELPQQEFETDPQQITVFGSLHSNREENGVITFIQGDDRFVVPPVSWNMNRFALRNYLGPNYVTDLPNSGYIELGELTWTVGNISALTTLYYNNALDITQHVGNSQVADGDTIWQTTDPNIGWTAWEFNKSPANILYTLPSDGAPTTTIQCDSPHGLYDGDLVTLDNIGNVGLLNTVTYTIGNVDSTGTMFTVPDVTYTPGTGGVVYAYRPIRFATPELRDSNPPLGGWKPGDLAFVDQGDVGVNGWTVYRRNSTGWNAIRTENYKVDSSLILSAKLYSQSNFNILATLSYYDPAKGVIPGLADVGLTYKGSVDPAKYNQGDTSVYSLNPSSAWGAEHLGETWWDFSSVRYVNYEIGDDSYRRQNWGKIAPGTSINVYEWVRSPISPSNWVNYVETGQSFAQFGISYTPSGTLRNSSDPSWCQINEYDSNGNLSIWYYFWVMNAYTLPLPTGRSLTTLQISNILSNPSSAGIPWFAAIDANNIIVSGVSSYLNDNDTVMQILYTQKQNDSNDHKQWQLVRSGDASCVIDNFFWGKLRDSLVGFDGFNNSVPDMNLSTSQRYGTLIRPRQSWFKNRIQALEIYVTQVNTLLSQVVIRDNINVSSWSTYFNAADPIPAQSGNYDYVVSSVSSLNALTPQNGQKALVLPNISTNNLWMIYQFEFASNVWYPILVQKYNTTNYWDYVDWYDASSGVSSSTIPNYIVSQERDLSTLTPSTGDIAKVLNNGNNLWELWQYSGSTWTRVGFQSGTIQLSTSLYDGSAPTITEFDEGGFDSAGFDLTPTIELANIFNGILYAIFGTPIASNTAELNTIFFSMINYVLAEQGFVDWIFKTSHIVLNGFNNPLYTGDLYQSDNIEDLLSYIDEIRPYRSKIRQFISGRTSNDNVNVTSTDFDLPPYNGEILDVKVASDANIIANTTSLQAWYNNYQSNPQLIRTLKTTLVFDRIASYPQGWDTNTWDSVSWQYEGGSSPGYGAWDRIAAYYQPTEGMIPLGSDELISGTAFKGVLLSGIGFNIDIGWMNSVWDSELGWDAGTNNFQSYLDLIIQGGVSPLYSSYYGDGITKSFDLKRVPIDVPKTVVWSDNILRTYGVDWIIPNWVVAINIMSRGAGYQVGDILFLDIQPSVEAAQLAVTEVDSNGGLVSVAIVSGGNYDIVPSGTVSVIYSSNYQGSGSSAVVQPVWGGSTLVFKTPPSSSSTLSIFVLFSGETFEPAPAGYGDMITDGYSFVQPTVADDHAEELFNAKLINSLRLDVYTAAVGGRPSIYIRSYITDGITDQFDLGLKPQDVNSVIATLNGNLLTYGINNDYVINFYTNKLVFIIPPPASGKLQIFTIGTGGTGFGISVPFVVDPGSNYNIGDTITMAGNFIYPPVITVTGVKASSITISSPGTKYTVGDQLILIDDYQTIETSQIALQVTKIDGFTGAIISAEILNSGNYTVKPLVTTWSTSSNGNGAIILINWGVSTLSVNDPGLCAIKQFGYITQSSTTGSGTGLVIGANYSDTLGTAVFKGDGSNQIFPVTFPLTTTDKLLVTVDGIIQGFNNVSIDQLNVVIYPPPALNSTVVITSFNTNNFSTVYEQEFLVESGVNHFELQYTPGSSLPQYNSMLVIKNGLVLNPPPMNNFVANGEETIFSLNFTPPPDYPRDFYVYVDDLELTRDVDYTVTNDTFVLQTTPPAGSKITAVLTNLNHGFDYDIEQGNLLFVPNAVAGDDIKVFTFYQDVSYGWTTDTFVGNSTGVYILSDLASDSNSVMVFVNGKMNNLMWDYLINREIMYFSWDYNGWDTVGWQGSELVSSVNFNDASIPPIGSNVVVTYATGLQNQPAIAWRTLIDASGTSSTTAIDDARKTVLLSNVYVYSNEIEIADMTLISPAPGSIWIDNELIAYFSLMPAGTDQYPNRGIISMLRRGERGTSDLPSAAYNTLYYNGDGSNVYFPAQSGTQPLAETVFVDGMIQINTSINLDIGTYTSVIDPNGLPAGGYIVFEQDSIPPIGYKNVRITSLNTEAENTTPVHLNGVEVIDAGTFVNLPGGYQWESASQGLQYSTSDQAKFLLNHSGTRS